MENSNTYFSKKWWSKLYTVKQQCKHFIKYQKNRVFWNLHDRKNQAKIVKIHELESGEKVRSILWRRHWRIMNLRWILSLKIKKWRKCYKGQTLQSYEKIKDFPTDSQCCSWIGVWSRFVLIASNRWKVQANDIKTTFLQDKKIERTVYLRPPKQAKSNKIWKLQKCVYVLVDTSRCWCLPVKEELIKGS